MPGVSVIIPAYNSGSTIREAIESVLSQNFQDYEILVVDDCSSDSTVEVVNSMMREFSFRFQVSSFILHLISLPRNSGPAAARNRGIIEAKGEWIAFLDGDDAWLPGKLAMQMEYVKQNPDVALVCGGTLPWNGNIKDEGGNLPAHRSLQSEEGRPEIRTRAGKADDDGSSFAKSGPTSGFKFHPSSFRRLHLDEFVVSNPVATSTVLARKDAILAAGGFDEQFRTGIPRRLGTCRIQRQNHQQRH